MVLQMYTKGAQPKKVLDKRLFIQLKCAMMDYLKENSF